jgi:hypothetical protein
MFVNLKKKSLYILFFSFLFLRIYVGDKIIYTRKFHCNELLCETLEILKIGAFLNSKVILVESVCNICRFCFLIPLCTSSRLETREDPG